MSNIVLTKKHILDFLKTQKVMVISTYGKHPWVATVYYSFDTTLNIYFLSAPSTLHAKHIRLNPQVSVAIVDTTQAISKPKKGLQLWGECKEIQSIQKVKHTLRLWKDALNVSDPSYTYENMMKNVVKGRMFVVVPKMIKLFDQELFAVEDGEEPILQL